MVIVPCSCPLLLWEFVAFLDFLIRPSKYVTCRFFRLFDQAIKMRDTVRHHCLFFAHAHCSSFLRPFSSYVKFVMAMFPCSLLIAASRVCHNQVLVWYWQRTCHFFRHSPLSVLPPAWPYQLAFSFFLFLCALFFTELRSFWVVHMAVQCSQWFSFFLFLCLPFCSQNCCPFGLSAGLFDAWHWLTFNQTVVSAFLSISPPLGRISAHHGCYPYGFFISHFLHRIVEFSGCSQGCFAGQTCIVFYDWGEEVLLVCLVGGKILVPTFLSFAFVIPFHYTFV